MGVIYQPSYEIGMKAAVVFRQRITSQVQSNLTEQRVTQTPFVQILSQEVAILQKIRA